MKKFHIGIITSMLLLAACDSGGGSDDSGEIVDNNTEVTIPDGRTMIIGYRYSFEFVSGINSFGRIFYEEGIAEHFPEDGTKYFVVNSERWEYDSETGILSITSDRRTDYYLIFSGNLWRYLYDYPDRDKYTDSHVTSDIHNGRYYFDAHKFICYYFDVTRKWKDIDIEWKWKELTSDDVFWPASEIRIGSDVIDVANDCEYTQGKDNFIWTDKVTGEVVFAIYNVFSYNNVYAVYKGNRYYSESSGVNERRVGNF